MSTALVAALAVEIAPLVREARAIVVERRLGRRVYRGRLGTQEVLLGELGIGKVRAAAALQSLIERYPLERVIVLGGAGALNPALRVGDMIVAQRVTQHDFALATRRRLLGGRRGWIKTDAGLSQRLLAAGRRAGLAAQMKSGSIVTGDTSIDDGEVRQRLWKEFRADCVEMEGAAVGLVCRLNRIPFALVRGLTDRADEQAVASFRASIKEVSEAVAKVVGECVRAL